MFQPHGVHFSTAESKESFQNKLFLKNSVQELTFLSTYTFLTDLSPLQFFPFAQAYRGTDLYCIYKYLFNKINKY